MLDACCLLLGGGAVLGEWIVLTVSVSQVVVWLMLCARL